MEIAEILDMISDGINPSTGEILDMSVFEQEETLAAFKKLKKAITKPAKKGNYRKLCDKYPGHIVLVKVGFFYSAYFESAEILGQVMGYKVAYTNEGRTPMTGGPDLCTIAEKLRAANISYVAINHGEVEDRFEGKDPFI